MTRWVWDGNNPLHEWVEHEKPKGGEKGAELPKQQARPRSDKWSSEPPKPEPEPGTRDAPITWLFEPDSFAPLGKMVGDSTYGIVTDHLGTPLAMYDAREYEVWTAELGVYGQIREVEGLREACPFRWPGQYEDAETGLYYNRFRYYDIEAGTYISQDPANLLGGDGFYAYVADPLAELDPLGLRSCTGDRGERIARSHLTKQGYTIEGQLKNRSGHGIDLIARDPAGRLTFVEVKFSQGTRTGALSPAQRRGSTSFARSRLHRGALGRKHWSHVDNPNAAKLASAWLDEMTRTGSPGVFVRITEGSRKIGVSPW